MATMRVLFFPIIIPKGRHVFYQLLYLRRYHQCGRGRFSSTGTIYELQDTSGEWPGGAASSSSYTVKGGYQAMDLKYLSLNSERFVFKHRDVR